MAAPLEGIRVVELANWLAAPSATALLCDLGAEVIKIEPPAGDAYRGLETFFKLDHNYAFELDNRGKRSITIDLEQPGGPALVRRLAGQADIFVTNLVRPRRARFGVGEAEVRAVKPDVIYVAFTGYGSEGPEATRPGFDYVAFWARSGIWGMMGEPGGPPALCRPGQGDHTTALNIVAATLAALRLRDGTGEGQSVEVTLQGTGIWTIGVDMTTALAVKQQPPRMNRASPWNPLANSYETRDGGWVLLMMPMPDPYWAPFCRMIGREEWLEDPRLQTFRDRQRHREELVRAIGEAFSEDDLASWARRLDAAALIWAPMTDLPSVVADPQARAMGVFATIDHPQLGEIETLSTPFQIRGADVGPRGPAPAVGEHTQEVLEEYGLSAEEMAELASNGVFG